MTTVAPPPVRDPFGSLGWQAWFQSVYQMLRAPLSGATTARPTTGIQVGTVYFDTTLTRPVWYTGTGWVDATGTPS